MRPYCPLRCLFALFYFFCGSVWCSEARIQFQNRFPPFPPFQALSLPLLHILLNNFFFYYSINRRIWRIFFIKKKNSLCTHCSNECASIHFFWRWWKKSREPSLKPGNVFIKRIISNDFPSHLTCSFLAFARSRLLSHPKIPTTVFLSKTRRILIRLLCSSSGFLAPFWFLTSALPI